VKNPEWKKKIYGPSMSAKCEDIPFLIWHKYFWSSVALITKVTKIFKIFLLPTQNFIPAGFATVET